MLFTRQNLEDFGFVGWLPFADVRSSPCPTTGGVYVATYGGGNPTEFAERSGGGWFKGQEPSVPSAVLAANWVENAEVVYIGMSGQLRRALRLFADFGEGKPIGHWGGRLIWQLPDTAKLLVAWKETPGQVPKEVKAELLGLFRQTYGKPPFANDPDLLGR
jgi:hypothetical protein